MKRKLYVLLAVLLAVGAAAALGDRKAPAEKEFHAALGRTEITVYPAVVRMGSVTQSDVDAARQVAAFFEARKLGRAVVVEQPLAFPLQGSMNQAKMYRRSLAAFQSHIRAHPPQTRYAALPEYLLSTSGNVGGIHCYVVRADGEEADGVLLNSHWKEFKAVKPKSVQDATRALLLRLEAKWKPSTS